VKASRSGQATPLVQKTYEITSDAFVAPAYKLFWALAWYTGESPQAILNLEVANVYVNPKERKSRDTIVYPCSSRKDKKTREVPVHRNLSLALVTIYKPSSEGLLFPSPYNSAQPITYQAVDKALRVALEKTGLSGKGYSLYSARRGFIMQLLEKEPNIKVVQRLTGHSSITSLMKYVKAFKKQV
jgi:integrase/recombinase XerD